MSLLGGAVTRPTDGPAQAQSVGLRLAQSRVQQCCFWRRAGVWATPADPAASNPRTARGRPKAASLSSYAYRRCSVSFRSMPVQPLGADVSTASERE